MTQNSNVLTILDDYRENGLKYDHLKTEVLPYNPLYFSPGSKRVDVGSITKVGHMD